MDDSNEQFLRAFLDLSLPPSTFDHVGHLRIAWIFLQAHDLSRATEQVCRGIHAYATHLGAAAKFNRTITIALMHILNARGAADTTMDWPAFLAANEDLVRDAKGILARYYSQDLLAASSGRDEFLAPDLAPLPLT